ncbi:MAG: phosphatidate cytidylyltransferase [Actinomycetales bacterium]
MSGLALGAAVSAAGWWTFPTPALSPPAQVLGVFGPLATAVPVGFAGPAVMSATALGVSGVAVWAAGSPVLRQRWWSWAVILPVTWLVLVCGPATTAAFAAAVGLVAAREFARLVGSSPAERFIVAGGAIGAPLLAWLSPDLLRWAPLVLVVSAVPAVLAGDTRDGLQRAALTAFGTLWIGWALAHLVLGWQQAYLIVLAVAAADVGAWCAGTGLRRFAWAGAPLTPVSPGKTRGGLLGSVLGAATVLILAGRPEIGLILVVGLGAVVGDLIESLAKRSAGVKDAGSWLPGFGGMLDRIDSLLVVLPVAAAVTTGL